MKVKNSMFLAAAIAAAVVSCSRGSEASSNLDPAIALAVESVSADSVKAYIDALVGFHTRHTLSTQSDPERGIGAAVDYLAAKCSTYAEAATDAGRPVPTVEKVYFTVGGPGTRYERVQSVPMLTVTIPGTEAEREILLMAHIDNRVADLSDSVSFTPGANDDGSGLSCLLEAVRIFSKTPLKQTVKCLFVAGEEQGLDGSVYFARKARQEGWPVEAVLSNDMIGNAEASGTDLRTDKVVRIFSESLSGEDSDNRQLARYIKEIGEKYVPGHEVKLMYRSDRYRRSGDQVSFLDEGFTAIRVSEYYENYDRTHQDVREEDGIAYGDMPSGVDIPYLVKNIKVNVASVASLAQAPARPQNAEIANARDLGNTTVLSWTSAADAAEYEILLRETEMPVWSAYDCVAAAPAGESQSFEVPLSKDNYFYAVRAVSKGGHPSLPAVCR